MSSVVRDLYCVCVTAARPPFCRTVHFTSTRPTLQTSASQPALGPVQGAKYLKHIQNFLDQLPATGVAGEAPHSNRKLHMREVAAAYFLAFFNPALQSLRRLQDFSDTPKGQQCFADKHISRSAFSELVSRLPIAPMQPLIQQLMAEARSRAPAELEDLPQVFEHVLAVDGTFLSAASDIAWALASGAAQQRAAAQPAPPAGKPRDASAPRPGRTKAKVRLDVHLNALSWLPEVFCVQGQGTSEAASAAANIQPGAVHLYDRGVFSFALVQAQAQAGGKFVARLRIGERCPKFASHQERPLSERDRQARVISDRLGCLAGSEHRDAPDLLLREVIVELADGSQVRLLTNLLDEPAWVIVLLYQYRWQVELFFRWLKTYAGFAHLLHHSRQGVELQIGMALIAILALCLETGARPSRYSHALLAQVVSGEAQLEDILPILARRERACQLARERQRRLRGDPTAPRRRYGLSTPKH
jgi:transposase